MNVRWSFAALIGIAGVWLAVQSATPSAPAIIGRNLDPGVAALEAQVSANPADAEALTALVNLYLAHSAPGLAQAALDRAPREVRVLPGVADARARTLWELGRSEVALSVQRGVLSSCASRQCSPSLLGHAQRRERMLAELVRLGVDDPKEDPNLALVAYRRSTREVSLDLR
jgi:hypothetical protein